MDILPSSVKFLNGRGSKATKKGRLVLSRDYYLDDVLYVPNFNCTLISVSRLLRQTRCIAIFTDTLCVLQNRFTKTLIGTSEEREGVYYFIGVKAASVNKTAGRTASTSELWHRRFGHPSFRVLSFLPILDKLCFDSDQSSSSCETCFRAKQTHFGFSESSNKASAPFSLIHCMFGDHITLILHVMLDTFLQLWMTTHGKFGHTLC